MMSFYLNKFEYWLAEVLSEDLKSGLRVGQSYLNTLYPSEACPELFYETDPDKAWSLILERENTK